MPSLVIDPSVAAAWCFKDEATPYTDGVLGVVSGPGEAIAPRLFAYELRNSVLMGVRRGRIASKIAQEFLQSLRDLRIHLTDPVSYDAVFSLAERSNLTVYDASYLDLAIRERLPVASLDAALLRAATASGIAVFRPPAQMPPDRPPVATDDL